MFKLSALSSDYDSDTLSSLIHDGVANASQSHPKESDLLATSMQTLIGATSSEDFLLTPHWLELLVPALNSYYTLLGNVQRNLGQEVLEKDTDTHYLDTSLAALDITHPLDQLRSIIGPDSFNGMAMTLLFLYFDHHALPSGDTLLPKLCPEALLHLGVIMLKDIESEVCGDEEVVVINDCLHQLSNAVVTAPPKEFVLAQQAFRLQYQAILESQNVPVLDVVPSTDAASPVVAVSELDETTYPMWAKRYKDVLLDFIRESLKDIVPAHKERNELADVIKQWVLDHRLGYRVVGSHIHLSAPRLFIMDGANQLDIPRTLLNLRSLNIITSEQLDALMPNLEDTTQPGTHQPVEEIIPPALVQRKHFTMDSLRELFVAEACRHDNAESLEAARQAFKDDLEGRQGFRAITSDKKKDQLRRAVDTLFDAEIQLHQRVQDFIARFTHIGQTTETHDTADSEYIILKQDMQSTPRKQLPYNLHLYTLTKAAVDQKAREVADRQFVAKTTEALAELQTSFDTMMDAFESAHGQFDTWGTEEFPQQIFSDNQDDGLHQSVVALEALLESFEALLNSESSQHESYLECKRRMEEFRDKKLQAQTDHRQRVMTLITDHLETFPFKMGLFGSDIEAGDSAMNQLTPFLRRHCVGKYPSRSNTLKNLKTQVQSHIERELERRDEELAWRKQAVAIVFLAVAVVLPALAWAIHAFLSDPPESNTTSTLASFPSGEIRPATFDYIDSEFGPSFVRKHLELFDNQEYMTLLNQALVHTVGPNQPMSAPYHMSVYGFDYDVMIYGDAVLKGEVVYKFQKGVQDQTSMIFIEQRDSNNLAHATKVRRVDGASFSITQSVIDMAGQRCRVSLLQPGDYLLTNPGKPSVTIARYGKQGMLGANEDAKMMTFFDSHTINGEVYVEYQDGEGFITAARNQVGMRIKFPNTHVETFGNMSAVRIDHIMADTEISRLLNEA